MSVIVFKIMKEDRDFEISKWIIQITFYMRCAAVFPCKEAMVSNFSSSGSNFLLQIEQWVACLNSVFCWQVKSSIVLPVVPHKAVAEVSE